MIGRNQTDDVRRVTGRFSVDGLTSENLGFTSEWHSRGTAVGILLDGLKLPATPIPIKPILKEATRRDCEEPELAVAFNSMSGNSTQHVDWMVIATQPIRFSFRPGHRSPPPTASLILTPVFIGFFLR
jgi:hypothetical protein